jgi:hypothetical protein
MSSLEPLDSPGRRRRGSRKRAGVAGVASASASRDSTSSSNSAGSISYIYGPASAAVYTPPTSSPPSLSFSRTDSSLTDHLTFDMELRAPFNGAPAAPEGAARPAPRRDVSSRLDFLPSPSPGDSPLLASPPLHGRPAELVALDAKRHEDFSPRTAALLLPPVVGFEHVAAPVESLSSAHHPFAPSSRHASPSLLEGHPFASSPMQKTPSSASNGSGVYSRIRLAASANNLRAAFTTNWRNRSASNVGAMNDDRPSQHLQAPASPAPAPLASPERSFLPDFSDASRRAAHAAAQPHDDASTHTPQRSWQSNPPPCVSLSPEPPQGRFVAAGLAPPEPSSSSSGTGGTLRNLFRRKSRVSAADTAAAAAAAAAAAKEAMMPVVYIKQGESAYSLKPGESAWEASLREQDVRQAKEKREKDRQIKAVILMADLSIDKPRGSAERKKRGANSYVSHGETSQASFDSASLHSNSPRETPRRRGSLVAEHKTREARQAATVGGSVGASVLSMLGHQPDASLRSESPSTPLSNKLSQRSQRTTPGSHSHSEHASLPRSQARTTLGKDASYISPDSSCANSLHSGDGHAKANAAGRARGSSSASSTTRALGAIRWGEGGNRGASTVRPSSGLGLQLHGMEDHDPFRDDRPPALPDKDKDMLGLASASSKRLDSLASPRGSLAHSSISSSPSPAKSPTRTRGMLLPHNNDELSVIGERSTENTPATTQAPLPAHPFAAFGQTPLATPPASAKKLPRAAAPHSAAHASPRASKENTLLRPASKSDMRVLTKAQPVLAPTSVQVSVASLPSLAQLASECLSASRSGDSLSAWSEVKGKLLSPASAKDSLPKSWVAYVRAYARGEIDVSHAPRPRAAPLVQKAVPRASPNLCPPSPSPSKSVRAKSSVSSLGAVYETPVHALGRSSALDLSTPPPPTQEARSSMSAMRSPKLLLKKHRSREVMRLPVEDQDLNMREAEEVAAIGGEGDLRAPRPPFEAQRQSLARQFDVALSRTANNARLSAIVKRVATTLETSNAAITLLLDEEAIVVAHFTVEQHHARASLEVDPMMLHSNGVRRSSNAFLAQHHTTARLRDQTLDAHAILSRAGAAVVLTDLSKDWRFHERESASHSRFYAAASVLCSGLPVGTLSVAAASPRELAREQRDMLVAAAAEVAQELERIQLEALKMKLQSWDSDLRAWATSTGDAEDTPQLSTTPAQRGIEAVMLAPPKSPSSALAQRRGARAPCSLSIPASPQPAAVELCGADSASSRIASALRLISRALDVELVWIARVGSDPLACHLVARHDGGLRDAGELKLDAPLHLCALAAMHQGLRFEADVERVQQLLGLAPPQAEAATTAVCPFSSEPVNMLGAPFHAAIVVGCGLKEGGRAWRGTEGFVLGVAKRSAASTAPQSAQLGAEASMYLMRFASLLSCLLLDRPCSPCATELPLASSLEQPSRSPLSTQSASVRNQASPAVRTVPLPGGGGGVVVVGKSVARRALSPHMLAGGLPSPRSVSAGGHTGSSSSSHANSGRHSPFCNSPRSASATLAAREARRLIPAATPPPSAPLPLLPLSPLSPTDTAHTSLAGSPSSMVTAFEDGEEFEMQNAPPASASAPAPPPPSSSSSLRKRDDVEYLDSDAESEASGESFLL